MTQTAKPEKENRPKIAQGQETNVTPLRRTDKTLDYDTRQIRDFLSMVFHALPPDSEAEPLTWFAPVGSAPSYPVPEDELVKRLSRTQRAGALYFGTGACRPEPRSGRLLNRLDTFKSLHVVVMDDIGTKVPLDKLPKKMHNPTYIIESSEGNFQYGYVLDEPVTDVEQARALIEFVYTSGYCDEGGKMPTKLVRLPGGINGKPGDKQDFEVRLVQSDGPLWKPQAILNGLDVSVDWEEVKKDARAVSRSRALSSGLSAWSSIPAKSPSVRGVVDPVLEWLYEKDMVQQETDVWTTIRCPWGENHSTGDMTAGYAPIGRGTRDTELMSRGFHCFHEHCADKNTNDFLSWVADHGGPYAAMFDPSAQLLATHAIDISLDGVWDLSTDTPSMYSLRLFKDRYSKNTFVSYPEGKMRSVSLASLFLQAPHAVQIEGPIYDPGTTSLLVEYNNKIRLNGFRPMPWGDGDIDDQEDVDRFLSFLEYLIPNKDERDYVIDYIACKAQDLTFRGNAILMVAKSQGTGRTTFSDMLTTLFTESACANIEYDELIGKTPYNEWIEKLLLFCHEIKDTGRGSSKYAAYERLKGIIDPRSRVQRINPKYGRVREAMINSSLFMFSNHMDAVALPKNDRRVMVVMNALAPASEEYFERLNAWLAVEDPETKRPKWAKSVWRFLRNRRVDVKKMTAPVQVTPTKSEMIMASVTPIQAAAEAVVEAWPYRFISPTHVAGFLETHFGLELDIAASADTSWKRQVSYVINERTIGLHAKAVIKSKGKAVRARALSVEVMEDRDIVVHCVETPPPAKWRDEIREAIEGLTEPDTKAIKERVQLALDPYLV